MGGQNLALKRDGTVWFWGGAGVWGEVKTPVQVSGLSGFVRAIATGTYGGYCLALKMDGTVWGWAPASPWSAPRQVSGLAGVTAIALAGDHGVAAKYDGTVWEWRILYPDPQFPTYPETLVRVSGLTSVVSLAASDSQRLAVKADGTVWEWGANTANSSPALQVSGLEGIVAVAAGAASLALKNDGTLWAWGSNAHGELGEGTLLRRSVPARLQSIAAVASVAAGGTHSLARKTDGTVLAWGGNDCRQLGDGTSITRPEPVEMLGVDGVAAIAAGDSSSVVMKSDGTPWSVYDASSYGSPPPAPDEPPRQTARQVTELEGVAMALPGQQGEIMVVKTDGTVWQWWGGNYQYPPSARQVKDLSGIAALATGPAVGVLDWDWAVDRRLALAADGRVWRWGFHGETAFLVGDINNVVAVAAGGSHDLALKADGTVWSWGLNTDGQLGDGTTISRTNAALVSGLTGVVAIAAGADYNVAVKRDGTVWSWGANGGGQLGDGTTITRTIPVQVVRLSGITAVSARSAHTLALGSDGAVWTWGDDGYGQLGDSRALMRADPVQVIPPGSPDLAITASHERDFAVGAQGVYTLTITNTGLTATAGTVTVSDSLPPGLTYVSGIGSGWTCSVEDQEVTCTNPGRLEPGIPSVITLTVEVGVSAWPGVTNLATVRNESDRTLANNAAGDPTVVLRGQN
jgi:uncharacterized repeat protein (TIGR01451 family)